MPGTDPGPRFEGMSPSVPTERAKSLHAKQERRNIGGHDGEAGNWLGAIQNSEMIHADFLAANDSSYRYARLDGDLEK